MNFLRYNIVKVGVVCVVCLLMNSCTNLDDVNERVNNVESDVENLKTAVKQLQQAQNEGKLVKNVSHIVDKDGWIITFSDGSSLTIYNGFESVEKEDGFVSFIMRDGRTFKLKVFAPRLTSLDFLASANPNNLIDNVYGEIVGDSVVECWTQYIMDSKVLIPHFAFDGDEVTIGEDLLISDITAYDFKTPVTITVKAGGETKDYHVYVHAFTGIPVLWIETEGRADVVSKDDYVNAHFKLVEDIVTRAPGDVTELDGKIKGRGNSTWGMAKKPYAIKFDEKQSFFGEPRDKSWVLLANYADKTSLRNAMAFYLGKISNLDYTPRCHFVDVMLNGRYNGTYQLCEKIKIGKSRVNVGDDGFLMEIDAKALNESDSRYFNVSHISNPINIKDPNVEYDDDNFLYAKKFVTEADKVLFSGNFLNPEEGWQKYLDMDSFVEWYLVNEIAKNSDACGYSSCYLNLKPGGKLKMGPIWDFDLAFGNIDYADSCYPEGFWVKQAFWYKRLFQDPVFVSKVKERFAYFYNKQSDIMNEINQNAKYLRYSVIENNNKWNVFYNYTWPNYDIWGNYQNEVQSMKLWIQKRFEWLKNEFDKM